MTIDDFNLALGTNICEGDIIAVKLSGASEPRSYTMRVGTRKRKRKREYIYEQEYNFDPEITPSHDKARGRQQPKSDLAQNLTHYPYELKHEDERIGYLKYVFREDGEIARQYYDYIGYVSKLGYLEYNAKAIIAIQDYLKPIDKAADYWVEVADGVYTQKQLDRMEYDVSPKTGKRETKKMMRDNETGEWIEVRQQKETGIWCEAKNGKPCDDNDIQEMETVLARKYSNVFTFSEIVPEEHEGSICEYINNISTNSGNRNGNSDYSKHHDSGLSIETRSLFSDDELAIANLRSQKGRTDAEVYKELGLSKSAYYTHIKHMNKKLRDSCT